MGAVDEQIAYYRARAGEYDDDAYDSRSDDWKAEMARLVAVFDGFDLAGDVVEVAAGTRQWTRRLAARDLRVTAIDAAPEMLDITRARLVLAGLDAELVVADALSWRPARTWDAVVACFWLSHVPDDDLPRMLEAMAAAVWPGGSVFVADKMVGKGKERRVLRDGRAFTVVDRPRPIGVLRAAFDAAGFEVEIDALGTRFVAIHGTRR